MMLEDLVGDLPMVIAKAIMKFIKNAEDHDKEFLTVQGDINVVLPDLNILIGLNQTLTQEEYKHNSVDQSSQTDLPCNETSEAPAQTSSGAAKAKAVEVATVSTQTIKMEPEKDEDTEAESSQNPIGVIENVVMQEESSDEDDFNEIPFDITPRSPESLARLEESMEIEDLTPSTPRTRSRTRTENSELENSSERPRRKIKHTPKLQELLTKKIKAEAKRRVQAEDNKLAENDSAVSMNAKKARSSKGASEEMDSETFKCTLCDKSFNRRSNLKDHMFVHNRENSYKCPQCEKFFLRLSKLKAHHQKVHDEPLDTQSLLFFKSAVSGLEAVAAFEEQADKKQEVFQCDICNRCFNRKSSLKDHMFVHNPQSSYQCPKCKKFFLRLSKLKGHHLRVHGDELDVSKLPPPRQSEIVDDPPMEEKKKGEHECPVCLRMFTRHSGLKEHMFTHDRAHGFKCEACGLTCVSEARLKRHITRRHGPAALVLQNERPHQCPECPQTFKEEDELNAHIKSHLQPKEFKCGRCEDVFPSLTILHNHQKAVHLKKQSNVSEREFKCGICLNAFTNSSALKHHLKIHGDMLRCDVCDKTFVREEQLIFHYEKIHGLKRDRRDEWLSSIEVRCLICGEDFNYYDLLLHQSAHSNLGVDFKGIEGCVVDELQGDVDASNITFSCSICNNFKGRRVAAELHMETNHEHDLNLACEYCEQKFWKESSLRSHLMLAHSARRLYECRLCIRKFMKQSDLSNHRKTHHPGVSQSGLRGRVQCKQCDKTFNTPSRLEDHVWVVHDKKQKLLKCPHCPKRFMRNYYLKEHIQSHTGAMRFVCEICGKGFRRPYELEQHRHDNELLQCDICQTTFSSYNGYKTHVRRHTETPSLMCRFCGKTFFFKVHLTNHERCHTGEKPFECSICRKAFRTKNFMNEHKKIHGDSRFNCQQCYRSFPLRRQLTAHVRSQHGEKQQWQCTQCDKAFSKKQSLQSHMAKHTLFLETNSGEPAQQYVESPENEDGNEANEAVVYLVVDENARVIHSNTVVPSNIVVSQAEDHVFAPTP